MRRGAWSVWLLLLLVIAGPSKVRAQLRPLEPMDWAALTGEAAVRVRGGGGWYEGQRASLAGTKGRLIEAGEVAVTVRVGRVVLEFAGTPQRFFRDEERFANETGGALPQDGHRHDSGDYRVATVIPLTSAAGAILAALRFGTRLPTTDNLVGLDRDQIDFFALLGGQWRGSLLSLGGELGVSINGTRLPEYEQSDVLAYSGSARREFGGFALELVVAGQEDLKERKIRGNEDLGEARVGLRVGSTRWLQASCVVGYREFSPRLGFQLGGGMSFKR